MLPRFWAARNEHRLKARRNGLPQSHGKLENAGDSA
jgi:hypothetical protein